MRDRTSIEAQLWRVNWMGLIVVQVLPGPLKAVC